MNSPYQRTQKRQAKHQTGRPSLYRPEIEAEMSGYIERGIAPSRATVLWSSERARIPVGNRKTSSFGGYKKAEGKLIRQCVALILAAAQGSALRDPVTGEKVRYEGTWTAAAWLLERRFPEFFGRIDRHHQGRA